MPGDRPANGRSPPASSRAERSSRGTDGGDGHRGSRSGVVSSRRALRHERQPRRRSRTRRGSRRRRQAPRAFRPGVAVGLRRRSRGVDVAASAPGACRNAPIPANAAGMTCESPGKFLLKRGASVPAIRASRDARRPSRDARRRVKAGLADCRRGRCRRWRRCGPLDQCCIVSLTTTSPTRRGGATHVPHQWRARRSLRSTPLQIADAKAASGSRSPGVVGSRDRGSAAEPQNGGPRASSRRSASSLRSQPPCSPPR